MGSGGHGKALKKYRARFLAEGSCSGFLSRCALLETGEIYYFEVVVYNSFQLADFCCALLYYRYFYFFDTVSVLLLHYSSGASSTDHSSGASSTGPSSAVIPVLDHRRWKNKDTDIKQVCKLFSKQGVPRCAIRRSSACMVERLHLSPRPGHKECKSQTPWRRDGRSAMRSIIDRQ